jgi:hypothetical protein
MESSSSQEKLPTVRESEEAEVARGPNTLERIASFRFTYLAFVGFLALYLFSVRILETSLDVYFRSTLAQVASLEPGPGSAVSRLRSQLQDALGSVWVRPGGVRVDALVLAADGRTLLFASRGPVPSLPGESSVSPEAELALLPATIDVAVSVPHNSLAANAILVLYAALFLTTLFLYTRLLARREDERLRSIIEARDGIADRAAEIEGELAAVRLRLSRVEPVRASQEGAIRELQRERERLVQELHKVEARQQSLRNEDTEADTLRTEHEALEGLLDETLEDLTHRNEEIQELQRQLKRQSKSAPAAGKQSDQLARRLGTLYKNLEIDERAIKDLVDLRDETMKLRAEEALKRLSDESDQVAVRRKVGGLPPHLSILELGYAGKGRIYYTKGQARRFRILLVGTKASQKPDLEFLSRLPRGT